jgi:membrane-associated protease RseP (regulator of RpoE activity)
MTFSGEEQGLLGSAYFCSHPTMPLEETAAMVNLDMVGRVRPDKKTNKDKLEIGGVGTAKEFSTVVDELNKKYDFEVSKTASGFGPSDHTSFARKKVPVFFFFTGIHDQYHRPSDTVDTINFTGMKKIVDMCEELIEKMASQKERPKYLATAAPAMSPGRGDAPRLGIMPGNYNDAENKGVLVGGVSDGGPAAKAGLKEGDYIIEIAGKPVKNMTGYMTAMAGQKKGQSLELTIDRNGERKKVSITPE